MIGKFQKGSTIKRTIRDQNLVRESEARKMPQLIKPIGPEICSFANSQLLLQSVQFQFQGIYLISHFQTHEVFIINERGEA